jgi:hypothetical protein
MGDGVYARPIGGFKVELSDLADPAEAIELARLVAGQLACLPADTRNILCLNTALSVTLMDEVIEEYLDSSRPMQ